MKTNLFKITVIFIALVIAGVSMIVLGQETTFEPVLPLLGAAMFSSGLTYLLFKLA